MGKIHKTFHNEKPFKGRKPQAQWDRRAKGSRRFPHLGLRRAGMPQPRVLTSCQSPMDYCGRLQNHFPQFPCVPHILFLSLSPHEPQQGFFKFLNHILMSHTRTKFFYTLKELFGAVITYRLNFFSGKFQKLLLMYYTNKHERQYKKNCMSSTKPDCHKR